VLRRHGNMSSATLPFIVRDLFDAGMPRPWVGMAFGPGLAGELLVLG
jgi:predicted naringenin-chalcone synthase